jgi:hypothetical protein
MRWVGRNTIDNSPAGRLSDLINFCSINEQLHAKTLLVWTGLESRPVGQRLIIINDPVRSST